MKEVSEHRITAKKSRIRTSAIEPQRGTGGRHENQRGVVLILAAVAAFSLIGILGLGFDLGRMHVARNELQNYTDAAAIDAALKLDGTPDGLNRATTAATNNVNKWAFGTDSVTNVEVSFSQVYNTGFVANPGSALDYRFVRVRAEQGVPLFFMPLFPGVGFSRSVAAVSVAGQKFEPHMRDGIFPYSPDAHDPNDPNFGFFLGQKYTLRWAKYAGNPNQTENYVESLEGVRLVGCEGDMDASGFQPGEESNSTRGYIDLSDRIPLDSGGGAALIRDAILTRTSFELPIVPFSYHISPEQGQKETETTAMQDRAWEDTDPTTPTYFTTAQTATNTPPVEEMLTQYRSAYNTVELPRPPNGNGRRIVVTPINDPAQNGLVIGFAGFFLPPNPCAEIQVGGKIYEPCCGEYIGAVTSNGGSGGAAASSGPGAFRVVLFR